MMILMFAFIGYYSPEFTMIMSVVALVAAYMMGFYIVGYGALVSMILAAAIIIYKVRR